MEIHEAYTVLYNETKRALYDQDRWLSGRFKKNAAALTPESFLKEIEKLNQHLALVDVYRMNRQLLHEYLLFLLSNDKVALLIQKATPEMVHSISERLLKSISYLPVYYALPVLNKWMPVATMDAETAAGISKKIAAIKREEKRQKAYPWLVILITLLILIAMYYFSKK